MKSGTQGRGRKEARSHVNAYKIYIYIHMYLLFRLFYLRLQLLLFSIQRQGNTWRDGPPETYHPVVHAETSCLECFADTLCSCFFAQFLHELHSTSCTTECPIENISLPSSRSFTMKTLLSGLRVVTCYAPQAELYKVPYPAFNIPRLLTDMGLLRIRDTSAIKLAEAYDWCLSLVSHPREFLRPSTSSDSCN